MRKFFLLCISLATMKISVAQIPIEMENIYELAVCEPNILYKNANINTASITERWVNLNLKTISLEKFNEAGYLVCKKNIDSNLIGGAEIINIKRSENEAIIFRKISQEDYKKIMLKHSSFFWGKYLYFVSKNLVIRPSDSVIVKSRLTWTKDSSIHYQTFLNSNLIDSGIAITVFTDISPYSSSCISSTKDNSNKSLDSVVICKDIRDSSNQLKEVYTYFEGKISKKIVESMRACDLLSSDTVLFFYDSKGRISKEEIFSQRGFLEIRKEYTYEDNQQFKYWVEKYMTKDKLESKTLYDQDEKIHERIESGWKGQPFTRREIYKYNEKGLLSIVKYFDDGVLTYEKVINYTFF